MIKSVLSVALLAPFLGGCESFSTYASLGSCTPEIKKPVTPGKVVPLVAGAAVKFELTPWDALISSGNAFSVFQRGVGKRRPGERLVVAVADDYVFVRLTDYLHTNRTALDAQLEDEISAALSPQYPCFRFVRYWITDF